MELNKIYNGDCLEMMKKLPDNSIDLIFTDPPYALGSEVIIKPDGKPDYKKAKDFMNKWEMPSGEFWEDWFKQANRILKYGGHCLMFGIDRQNMMFKYYSTLAGFTSKQSIYWYFISCFPKSADLSKKIDKNMGAERKVIGKKEPFGREGRSYGVYSAKSFARITQGINEEVKQNNFKDVTMPATEIALKYNGYKYSVAPLKQTCEEIMVFQKAYKTGSCLHDILAMEKGDESITCGALNIDSNRIPTNDNLAKEWEIKQSKSMVNGTNAFNSGLKDIDLISYQKNERFPSQTFIDDDIAEKLNLQSGIKKSNSEGSSKIHHKCNYEKEDFDLFVYCPKVSNKERNMGCEDLEKKHRANLEGSNVDSEIELDDVSERFRTSPAQNNHPTVKPIKLLKHILSLFKTPNKQIVFDPFMGSGSICMVCKELDIDFLGIELNPDYFEIAKERIKNYIYKSDNSQLKLF